MRKKTPFFLGFLVVWFFFGPAYRFCWADDIREVKGPVNLPPNLLFVYLFLILFIIVSIILFIRFFLDKRKRGLSMDSKTKSYYEIAYERLENLRKQNLPALGKIKEYYIELSDIVRRYIEDRFLLRAPEMTTQEFLFSLKTSPDLKAEYQELLTTFLTSCDMVKFAKYVSNPKEIDESFKFAKRFIDETKPVVEDGKEEQS